EAAADRVAYIAADRMHLVRPDLDHDVAMSGSAIQVFQRRAAACTRRAEKVADLRGVLVQVIRDEGGARFPGTRREAPDIDRVAVVRAEEVARHAGARDVPGDERRRPRHLGVEAGEAGPVDALPVVVDAPGRVALLHAADLRLRRAVRKVDRLLAEAEP